jgi:hypothetical protein
MLKVWNIVLSSKELLIRGGHVSDIHLTLELLIAAYRGEVSPELVPQTSLQHLSNLCPTCKEEVRTFRRWLRDGRAGEYATALLLPALIEQQKPRVTKERRQARRDLETLLPLEPEERVRKVRRAQWRPGARR